MKDSSIMGEEGKINNIKHWYSNIMVFFNVVAMALILLVIFWLVYPYKTVEFKDKVFPVINKIVKRGKLVNYTANYCKYGDFTAIVTRTFRNGLIYVMPSTITNRPQGCHTMTVSVLIPLEIPIGTFIMEQVYKIQVNPIRSVTIIQNTEPFEVVE